MRGCLLITVSNLDFLEEVFTSIYLELPQESPLSLGYKSKLNEVEALRLDGIQSWRALDPDF